MASKKINNLTDGELEVLATTRKVTRLTKKQKVAQAELDALNTTVTAALAPLESGVDEAKAALDAVLARQKAFEEKVAARKAAQAA